MLILYVLFCMVTGLAASAQRLPTLAQWVDMTHRINPVESNISALVSYQAFTESLQEHISLQKQLLSQANWLGTPLDATDKKLSSFSYEVLMPITPLVFKLMAPTGSSFYFWGDLHGDIRTLAQSLQKLVDLGVLNPELDIIQENSYLFFLGDITDRGFYATEVITLLTQLARRPRNAQHVFLIRGNHEDVSINAQYAFMKELDTKFSAEFAADPLAKEKLARLLTEFYNLMAVAGFVGCNNNVVQCCHGGIEPGYNPTKLLSHPKDLVFEYIQELSPPPELADSAGLMPAQEKLHITPGCCGFWKNLRGDQITSNIGFMWSDFNGSTLQPEYTLHNYQRGIMYGRTLTDFMLDSYSMGATRVRGFIRGHQHNTTLPELLKPKNKNVWRMWDDKVITTIATSQFYTDHMTFIRLKTAPAYENWKLTRYSAKIMCAWQDC